MSTENYYDLTALMCLAADHSSTNSKSPYGNRVDPLFITTEPDNDVRCSFDVTDGVGTETATVLAGDEIGFGVSESLVRRVR